MVLAFAVSAFATSSPKLKSSQFAQAADGERYKLITWSLPTLFAKGTSGAACTLNMITQSTDNEWHPGSTFTLYGNFRTSNSDATADSGDILIKIKVGVDSAAYYWPVADSAHMILANGRMKQYTDLTAADSIYTYTAYSIDAPAQSGGLNLSLPLILPGLDQISWKRMQIIFASSKTKAADSIVITNGFILEKRPLVLTGTDSWR